MNTPIQRLAEMIACLAVLFLSIAFAPGAHAANTNDNILAGATDLGINTASTYTTAPVGTTTDITFATATTYTNAGSLLLNNAPLSVGTLNDLNATAITITGNKLLTLNAAANSVSGTAADLLYVRAGSNLTINNSAGITVAWLNKGGKSGESDSPIKAGLRARGSQGMW